MKERKIRFNFIDVLIILLIAVIIFALLYIFVLGDKKIEVNNETQYTTIRYVVQVTSVDERFDGMISVGDLVQESVSRKQIGKVVGVQSQPYQKVTFDYENGKETSSTVEGMISLNITVEAEAVETDPAFSVNGCDIRVGQQYSLALPEMYVSGFCIELNDGKQN